MIVYWNQNQSTQEFSTAKSGDKGAEEAGIWMLLMCQSLGGYRLLFSSFLGVGLKNGCGVCFSLFDMAL